MRTMKTIKMTTKIKVVYSVLFRVVSIHLIIFVIFFFISYNQCLNCSSINRGDHLDFIISVLFWLRIDSYFFVSSYFSTMEALILISISLDGTLLFLSPCMQIAYVKLNCCERRVKSIILLNRSRLNLSMNSICL